ncbi:1-phosphofructokinase family hexose kinase [Acidovorax sp. BL-A-41-H1]|uniref:1-phosphofructokinase family hexose kinase n=1 Tax=Acidovorax sp. BL-A-41-H1 TaxID=3421102 RepID=UPI003F7ABAAB
MQTRPAGIVTLTLNPALDLATTTAQVAPTHKLRCGPVQRFPGGGGINVARVLHRLGADVEAWALAGGAAGAQIGALLAAEGVPTRLQPIAGDTRENLSVVETSTGREFRFVLPGPEVAPSEWQALLTALTALMAAPDAERATPPATRWWVASGSLPPGLPDTTYADLARTARRQGVRLALDTSGPALAAALQAGVAMVKPSLRELRELLQQPLTEPADWHRAALVLVQQGQAEVVALSLGEQGALLATREGTWQAPALPTGAQHGTTGAGDCFMAALVWALDRGDAPPEALRWGIAAGAAALQSPGTSLAAAVDVRRLLAQVPTPVAL